MEWNFNLWNANRILETEWKWNFNMELKQSLGNGMEIEYGIL